MFEKVIDFHLDKSEFNIINLTDKANSKIEEILKKELRICQPKFIDKENVTYLTSGIIIADSQEQVKFALQNFSETVKQSAILRLVNKSLKLDKEGNILLKQASYDFARRYNNPKDDPEFDIQYQELSNNFFHRLELRKNFIFEKGSFCFSVPCIV